MPSESHVYDLLPARGNRKLGVVMPSRKERKADVIGFEGRTFIAQRDKSGGIKHYRESEPGQMVTVRGPVTFAYPSGVKYGDAGWDE